MPAGVQNPEVKSTRRQRRRQRLLKRFAIAAILLAPVLIVMSRSCLHWKTAAKLCGITREINIDTGQVRTTVYLCMLAPYTGVRDTEVSRLLKTEKQEWQTPDPWYTSRVHSLLVDGTATLRYRNAIRQLRETGELLAIVPIPAERKMYARQLLAAWHQKDGDRLAEELIDSIRQRKLFSQKPETARR